MYTHCQLQFYITSGDITGIGSQMKIFRNNCIDLLNSNLEFMEVHVDVDLEH